MLADYSRNISDYFSSPPSRRSAPIPKPSNFFLLLADKVWKIYKSLVYGAFFLNRDACYELGGLTSKFVNSVKPLRHVQTLSQSLDFSHFIQKNGGKRGIRTLFSYPNSPLNSPSCAATPICTDEPLLAIRPASQTLAGVDFCPILSRIHPALPRCIPCADYYYGTQTVSFL